MRCSVWREAAENVAESLTRGTRVIVTGRLKSRSYETKEGEKRTVVELEVDEVGPSLRYATAKVNRTQRSGGGGGGRWRRRQGGGGGQGGGSWGGSGGGSGGGGPAAARPTTRGPLARRPVRPLAAAVRPTTSPRSDLMLVPTQLNFSGARARRQQ